MGKMPTLAEMLGFGGHAGSVQESGNSGLQGILAAAKGRMPPARDFDAKFDTVLSAPEEQQFQKWKAKYAPKDSGADYDLRGAFKAGLMPGNDAHWSDEFKKPNHPTFSNQSRYAKFGTPGRWAGTWDPKTKTYTPPQDEDIFTPANVMPPPMIGVRG